jgi:hypothetical protein
MSNAPRFRVASFAILLACCACNRSSNDPGPPPPHGGSIINLPNGAGIVEVVTKPAPKGTASVTSELALYFYKDAFTPYSPAPNTGTLTLGPAKKVTLNADGGGLVTPPGPPLFANGEVDGSVTVDLDGKAQTIPLGLR